MGGIGDWGLGIGDWGLGIGPNPQSPIPNPQSPIPKSPIPLIIYKLYFVFTMMLSQISRRIQARALRPAQVKIATAAARQPAPILLK